MRLSAYIVCECMNVHVFAGRCVYVCGCQRTDSLGGVFPHVPPDFSETGSLVDLELINLG